MSPHSDHRWSGVPRFHPALIFAIFVLSLVSFIIAIEYGKAINNSPLKYDNTPLSARPSKSEIVFYVGCVPFLSLIHSAVDLTITFFSTLNPIYALVLSILFVGGWVGTASKWIGCGYGADESNTCPEFILEITNHALQTPRVVIGFLVFALYIAYAVFAALAVHKARKFSRERTAANLKMNVVESQQS